MNFGWMVIHVTGWLPFFVLGVVTQLIAVAVMLVLFRRRAWI